MIQEHRGLSGRNVEDFLDGRGAMPVPLALCISWPSGAGEGDWGKSPDIYCRKGTVITAALKFSNGQFDFGSHISQARAVELRDRQFIFF